MFFMGLGDGVNFCCYPIIGKGEMLNVLRKWLTFLRRIHNVKRCSLSIVGGLGVKSVSLNERLAGILNIYFLFVPLHDVILQRGHWIFTPLLLLPKSSQHLPATNWECPSRVQIQHKSLKFLYSQCLTFCTQCLWCVFVLGCATRCVYFSNE